ncbi:MAG: IS256 family transposase [Deltaproteobacteria bacterium]|nr:MAG: IS256 family transposase [Deltaproteobacteria bacterium]
MSPSTTHDNVYALHNPEQQFVDPIMELLRQHARTLISKAVEAEVTHFVEQYEDLVLYNGRKRVVRNGFTPERTMQTPVGPVQVKTPRVRDRGNAVDPIRFHSNILPPYLRKTRTLEELVPWLYLMGISTGQMEEAIQALLGTDAAGFSPSTVSRLKESWSDEFGLFIQRELSEHYPYIWVDGFYPAVKMEESRHCLLVVIGVKEDGHKEFLAIRDGLRESEQSWLDVLLDLQSRGLKAPNLAIGDGALGFWNALKKVFPETQGQRCWVHKTKNVLDKLPKSEQKKAKERLQDIYRASTKENAEKAWKLFVKIYEDKHERAVECLVKDKEALLCFYSFPAAHWRHIRTTNPIESTFATIGLRMGRTRGCLSRRTALAMVYKLGMCAQKRWRKISKPEMLTKLVNGSSFQDGELVENAA